MAREGLLVGVGEEELRPDPKPEQPKTFKGKWDNYWYLYKWQTLGALFAIVVLAVCISQAFSKNDPDYHIVMATSGYISETAVNKIEAALQKYGKDLDGDGKVEVMVETLDFDSEQPSYTVAAQTKLAAYLSSGDVMFYVFDKDTYDKQIVPQLNGEALFSPIGIKADSIDTSGNYWNWSGDVLRKDTDLSALPENLYFGVRAASGTAGGKSSTKVHDECMALLKAYITKTPLQTTATTTTVK